MDRKTKQKNSFMMACNQAEIRETQTMHIYLIFILPPLNISESKKNCYISVSS
jgi:hypothetical protein